MKLKLLRRRLFCVAIVLVSSALGADAELNLHLRPDGKKWTVWWPARLIDGQGVQRLPTFQLQRSDDLKQWRPVGSPLQAKSGAADEVLSVELATDAANGFYRLSAQWPSGRAKLATTGAEVFGYAAA